MEQVFIVTCSAVCITASHMANIKLGNAYLNVMHASFATFARRFGSETVVFTFFKALSPSVVQCMP